MKPLNGNFPTNRDGNLINNKASAGETTSGVYDVADVTDFRRISKWAQQSYTIDFLVVAGGGGGGHTRPPSSNTGRAGGGGGGAGGLRTNVGTSGGGGTETAMTVFPGIVYSVTVGAGGAGGDPSNFASNGSDSVFNGITSLGGGRGAGYNYGATVGGSGGGGSYAAGSNVGTAGQGFNGSAGPFFGSFDACGGGGGGASASAVNPGGGVGNGGAGILCAIDSVARGGGGGGNYENIVRSGGNGGYGGGGKGAGTPVSGTVNTGGGGGGGGSFSAFNGAAGGSGVVVIRTTSDIPTATCTGNPSISEAGGYKTYTFTGSGTIIWGASAQIVTSGLIQQLDASISASYPGTGSTWFDQSGFGNNAALINTPTFSSDNSGTFIFDGVNETATTNVGASLSAFSVALWVRTTDTSSNGTYYLRRSFIGKDSSGTGSRDFAIVINSGYVGYWHGIGSGDQAIGTSYYVSDDNWHYVTVASNGTTAVMYVDGISIPSTATTITQTIDPNIPFYISYSGGNPYLAARYGAIHFYNRAITATEAYYNYALALTRFSIPSTLKSTNIVVSYDVANASSYPGSGTTLTDLSGNGINATLNANVTYDPTNSGSLVFNGSNSGANTATNALLNIQTFSIEIWIKTNATTQNGFFIEKGTVNSQYALFQEGTNITFRTQGTSVQDLNATTASYTTTSNWTHIIATIGSGVKKLYVNGFPAGSVSVTGTIPTNANGLSIGKYTHTTDGYFFNGRISFIRIYNAVLTDAEIRGNFNALRNRYGT